MTLAQKPQPWPCVLAVGGLDPSGGAGILLDCAVIRQVGAHPCAVSATLTVQSSARFEGSEPVSADIVSRCLQIVLEDTSVRAIKTGALQSAQNVLAVARAVDRAPSTCALVVDPVLVSTTGGVLLDDAARLTLLEQLLPKATLVTPNRAELERLTGQRVDSLAEAESAARQLISRGCGAVLVKGGHFPTPEATDWLIEPTRTLELAGSRLRIAEVRGTGCALASAIAAYLALGQALEPAVRQAKQLVAAAMGQARCLGPGAWVLGLS